MKISFSKRCRSFLAFTCRARRPFFCCAYTRGPADRFGSPFGASAAVHGFNRAAQALENVLTRLFGILCTHYFDDFTFLVPSTLGSEILEVVLEGWRWSGLPGHVLGVLFL